MGSWTITKAFYTYSLICTLQVPFEEYNSTIILLLATLADHLQRDMKTAKLIKLDDLVNCFVIAFEIQDLGCTDFLDVGLPAIFNAAEYLPVKCNYF